MHRSKRRAPIATILALVDALSIIACKEPGWSVCGAVGSFSWTVASLFLDVDLEGFAIEVDLHY